MDHSLSMFDMLTIEAHFRGYHAKDDLIKTTLKKIASDETRHAQLAWNTIVWIAQKYPEFESFVKRTCLIEQKHQHCFLIIILFVFDKDETKKWGEK